MKMKLDLGDGEEEVLRVYLDEDPMEVAKAFAARHNIEDDTEAVKDTADAIKQYVEAYRERKRRKRASQGK